MAPGVQTACGSLIESGLRFLEDARILVIDDEDIIIDAIAEILECAVYRANTLADGMQQYIDAGPFDLVLVDKNLPDGSGLGVIRDLKLQNPLQELILITGFPSLGSAIEAMEAGAFDYLPKPFEMATLIFKARNAVSKTRQNCSQQELLTRLRSSEARHRALFQASSDAILVIDGDTGCVDGANEAAASMFGYSIEGLLGIPRNQLLPAAPDDVSFDLELSHGELLMGRRRDGHEFPVEVSTGETCVDGRSASIEVVRDLSDRVRMHREREQTAQRLRKSEKMESLGQLAAGIAHDFNNLLVVFMGAEAEIGDWIAANPQAADEDLRYALEELCQASSSGQNLTKQLLGFGRRQRPCPEVLDVAAAIQSIAKLLSRTLTERVHIKIDLQEAVPHVRMDRGQLEQVITNLALNARDAMPAGGTLRIAALTAIGPSGAVDTVIRVDDTGSGMDEATMAHMYDPFFTTKDPERGTGLGLATVHAIIQGNGGEIRVKSKPGQGTSFEIQLSAWNGEDDQNFEEAPTSPFLERPGARILVVEDHEQVRSFVDRALTRAGYIVASAPDGETALQLVENAAHFDLLLTDEGLPTIQGSELATLICKKQDIRVLCMSAYAAGAAPVYPFLAKPFSTARLLEQVRETLGAAIPLLAHGSKA